MTVRKTRITVALLLFTALSAVAYQVRRAQQRTAPAALTDYIPQDALLTIQSPDFASLLDRWTGSAESRAWLTSDNHTVFEMSRLFGRLADAQSSFASAARIPTSTALLHEAAGKQSVFAWYDIGKLEFLYMTRMSAERARQTQLFQTRGRFERRHAGGADFYIRTSGEPYSTVAFAVVSTPTGDLLVVATREDLIANALKLIAAASPVDSVVREPWFRDASAALPPEESAPVLHMVLNLDRLARDPHFQTYWVQRNINWMRQFRAAASDLYLEPGRLREERILIPKNPEDVTQPPVDLASLAALAPAEAGVYRAAAAQEPADAVTAIQEKLLGSSKAAELDSEYAPAPSLEAPQAGSASDLETRIDVLAAPSPTASTDSLTEVIRAANIDAMLTLSSAQKPQRSRTDYGFRFVPPLYCKRRNRYGPKALHAPCSKSFVGL